MNSKKIWPHGARRKKSAEEDRRKEHAQKELLLHMGSALLWTTVGGARNLHRKTNCHNSWSTPFNLIKDPYSTNLNKKRFLSCSKSLEKTMSHSNLLLDHYLLFSTQSCLITFFPDNLYILFLTIMNSWISIFSVNFLQQKSTSSFQKI